MSCYFIDKSRGTQLLWGKFGYLYRKSRRHDWSGRPLRAVSESPLGKFMDQLLFLLNLYVITIANFVAVLKYLSKIKI